MASGKRNLDVVRGDGSNWADEVPARLGDGEHGHGVEGGVDVVGGVHPHHVAAVLGVPLLGQVQDVCNSPLLLLLFIQACLLAI